MKPYYEHAGITIYHGDCREVVPGLSEVALVATDPPYQGVLDADWDNQWANDGEFLAWCSECLSQFDAAMLDSATLYWFSCPRLASKIEAAIDNVFRVICGAVWDKGGERKGAAGSGVEVGALRTYWTANTERVVVAEKRLNDAFEDADSKAKKECGYWSACQKSKRSVIGDYLRAEFNRAGVTSKQVAALFLSKTGGMTGCVSNWLLGHNVPTAEQYETMRVFLGAGYLRREYEDLRREYEDLRREYEDLRREYEDLRRPFFLTANDQWGDVWRFPIERTRQHPAQKPLPLMAQIVRASSRPGDLVLDPFMGSGTTLRAAKDLGRRAIGIELEERYCEIAAKRLEQETLPFASEKTEAAQPKQSDLFAPEPLAEIESEFGKAVGG